VTDLLRDLAVFDLETTGVDVRTARIVTAYLGVLDASGEVVSSRSWMADPGIEIPEGAAAGHGITTERARADGRPAAVVVAEVLAAAGLDAQGLLEATQDPAVKAELMAATEAAAARGAFGIPTFFVGEEMFFGKDRLGQVEEALSA